MGERVHILDVIDVGENCAGGGIGIGKGEK